MLNSWNLPYNVILKCLRGLEHNLFKELESFGIDRNLLLKFNKGVTVLDCNLQKLYFLSYFSRLSTKVCFEVGKVSLLDKEKLFRDCEKIQWLDFINTGNSYLINCNILENNSNINSKKYACQLVKDGINKHFNFNLNVEPPTISFKQPEIKLELEVDEECNATILVDSVGSPLSNRGYRHKPNITDIDPTIACSILYDMGYSSFSDSPYSIIEYEKLCNINLDNIDSELQNSTTLSHLKSLSSTTSSSTTTLLNSDLSNPSMLNGFKKPTIVDLFSGCGVFLIEASLMSSRIPPGYFRDNFAFQKFHKYDDFAFQMLRKYTDSRKIKPKSEEWNELKGKFIGIERDWEKLESSVVSSETAGTLELMSFNQADYLKDGLIDAKKEGNLMNKDKENNNKENENNNKKEMKTKEEKEKEDNTKWEYMIAKLPQMKRLDIFENKRITNNNNKENNNKRKENNNTKYKEAKEQNNKENEGNIKVKENKNKEKEKGNKNNLSSERYSTLLKSLSRIKSKYFAQDSKGVVIVPSFIDKDQVQESFNSRLVVGKTFNKDGIDSTTYYT